MPYIEDHSSVRERAERLRENDIIDRITIEGDKEIEWNNKQLAWGFKAWN